LLAATESPPAPLPPPPPPPPARPHVGHWLLSPLNREVRCPAGPPGPSPVPWHPRDPAQVSRFPAVVSPPLLSVLPWFCVRGASLPGCSIPPFFSLYFFFLKKTPQFQITHYGPLFTMCHSAFNRFIHFKKGSAPQNTKCFAVSREGDTNAPLHPEAAVLGGEVLYPRKACSSTKCIYKSLRMFFFIYENRPLYSTVRSAGCTILF